MIVARRCVGAWGLAISVALAACSSPRPYDPAKFATGGSAGASNAGGAKGSGGVPTASGGTSSGGSVGSGGFIGTGGIGIGGGETGGTTGGTGGLSIGGAGPGGSSTGGVGPGGGRGGAGTGGVSTGGVGTGGMGTGGAGTGGMGTGGLGTGGCTQGAVQCSGAQPQVCMGGIWQNMGSACGICTACDAPSGTCKPTTGTCDDGNACTQTDTCQGGLCVGSNPKTCTASDQCHTAGICNTTTGLCSNPAKTDGASCSDQNSCTTSDMCQSGACVGTQLSCDNPPPCRLATTCSAGNCNYTQSVADGTVDTKCPTGQQYCLAGSCVQCTKDQQCSGSTPSCDLTTNTCVCRRPSAGNHITNPGFDNGFVGWSIITTSPASTTLDDDDSEGCSASKSVLANNDSSPYQCFPITQGVYYFGGRFKGDPSRGSFIRLKYFNGACGGSQTAQIGDDTLNVPLSLTDWLPQSMMVTVLAGTITMGVAVYGLSLKVDQLYLNTTNQY